RLDRRRGGRRVLRRPPQSLSANGSRTGRFGLPRKMLSAGNPSGAVARKRLRRDHTGARIDCGRGPPERSAMNMPAYSMNVASFPEMYERFLVGPLFRPWAEDLLERAALAPSDRVLDVACGTGIVARLAKARLGPSSLVVGVDASAPMIALAGEKDRTVDWRVGDAAALPVGGG